MGLHTYVYAGVYLKIEDNNFNIFDHEKLTDIFFMPYDINQTILLVNHTNNFYARNIEISEVFEMNNGFTIGIAFEKFINEYENYLTYFNENNINYQLKYGVVNHEM